MAHIRKRLLSSGKVRWQVLWEEGEDTSLRRGVKRASAMFDTQREAKEKLAAVLNSRPSSGAPFKFLTEHFMSYFERLTETGERERSTLRQLRQHIDLHILPDR